MNEHHLLAECVERAALAELHAAAPEAFGLELLSVAGAQIAINGRDPTILLNRVIGLGLDAPASAAAIATIKRRYADAGVGRYFVQVHPDARPSELRSWLAAAGFEPHRRWMKFVRGRKPPPAPKTDLRIEAIGPEQASTFGRIVAQGFDLSDEAVPMLAGLADRPGWRLYLSFADDEPAGTGAMYVDGEVAYLDWGATSPALRRRGSQRAVLARRIRDALDLGCTLMVTTTGEAVPGDPQHSYRNIEWAGFEPAYLRDNFVPARRI